MMIAGLALWLCSAAGVAPPREPAAATGPAAPAHAPANAHPGQAATLTADVLAGAAARFSEGAEPGVAFVLERAELGGSFRALPWFEGALRLEAIRSAGAQSAFGIDGNSLLPRFTYAWGGLAPSFSLFGVPVTSTLRAGLVPEPWLERLEPFLSTRALGPQSAEEAALLDASDLGANAGLTLLDGLIAVDLSVRNGEGKHEIELNLDKDVAAVLSSTAAVSLMDEQLMVTTQVMARHGTRGVTSAPEERAALGAGVAHPGFHAVGEIVWARGDEGDVDRDRVLVAAVGDVTFLPRWLGAVARGSLDLTEVKLPQTTSYGASIALFSDLGHDGKGTLPRMRALGGVAGTWAEPHAALAGIPAANTELRVFLLLEATARAEALAP